MQRDWFLVILFFTPSFLVAQIPKTNVYVHAKELIEKSFPVKLNLKIGEFKDWNSGNDLECIEMEGEHITKPQEDPIARLCDALEKAGWISTFEYSADGPDGTVFTYSKNKVLLVFEIGWSPGHDDSLTEEEEKELAKLPVTYTLKLHSFVKK